MTNTPFCVDEDLGNLKNTLHVMVLIQEWIGTIGGAGKNSQQYVKKSDMGFISANIF